MNPKHPEISIENLTLLDLFAAFLMIGLANTKTPVSRRAHLAYGVAAQMLDVRKEYVKNITEKGKSHEQESS